MSDAQKPNILVLWGDDIGWYNISHHNQGAMGYSTPNIDRVAQEGIDFTDYYGQQSCTAGRSAFITGQNPLRTGLTKVGMPGSPLGLQAEDPTIAELLKPLGYTSGQFGKNHLGDRDEFLPTAHGFDEFYGNLYHLNAEEEPELPDYPKDPEFRKNFGPRGVIHSWAQPDGTQKIEDTGPLTRKRMETIDDDVTDRAIEFIENANAGGTPFFVWWNATRMHFRTHISDDDKGITGLGDYADAMVMHDRAVGRLLDKLDELGLAENTIVMYSTDNGAHYNTWPDAAISPWRSEKNSNWEGGYRVPCFLRWPEAIPAGEVRNGIVSHQDWLPTLLAAAGEPDISSKLEAGHEAGSTSFRVHIDGENLLPYLKERDRREPAQIVLLRERRRAAGGASVRPVEAGVHGATSEDPAGLGGAVRGAPSAKDIRPPHGPVRASRRELQHLLGLGYRSRLPALWGTGARGRPDRLVPAVPTSSETGVVQPGPYPRPAD